MKIFSLPKTATQSPRGALSSDIRNPRTFCGVPVNQCVNSRSDCGAGASVVFAFAGVRFSCAVRVVARMYRCVADQRASRALTPTRQHFLKQDSVFFNVLVYSGCSAFRFPKCTQ